MSESSIWKCDREGCSAKTEEKMLPTSWVLIYEEYGADGVARPYGTGSTRVKHACSVECALAIVPAKRKGGVRLSYLI